MVIIGYQGIGKSTLVDTHKGNGFIDLESSNFFIDGKRDENWYIPYCNIALNLSEQGYNVFTSSHEVVRKYFKRINNKRQPIILCYPDIHLRDSWIKKLKDRYEHTKSEKDFKALKNAEDRYLENIKELQSETEFYHCPLLEMDYNLFDLMSKTIKELKMKNNLTIEIKDFKDFSVEEIREVLNLIYSESIQIKNISEYNNEEDYFEVDVLSFWTTTNDENDEEEIEIEDTFYLSNSNISADDFPITRLDYSMYINYLKSHGYLDISENDDKFIKDIKSNVSFNETLDEFLIRTKCKVTDLECSKLVEHIRYRSYDYIAQMILKLIQYAKDEFFKELNTPKKTIKKEWNPSICPTCSKSFEDYEPCNDGYYERCNGLERCPYCGQKLDWF